jgi:nitrogen fixation/metabolism regulation signal transduction histidine kinase
MTRRLVLQALAGGLPALLVAALALAAAEAPPRWDWTLLGLAAAWLLIVALLAPRSVTFSLRTLANVLGALREGDYTVRLQTVRKRDALGEVHEELNDLARQLQDRRLRDLEVTALLRQVMAEIDVAVFAFDAHGRLDMVNAAGERALAASADALVGRSAPELGLVECLAGPPARTLALDLPGGTGRWQLRRGGFRQQGRPGSLVLLSDLGRALRDEELRAWRRLIRVIGHELNNSLAPITSIAGSLETMLAAETLPDDWREDARRGLAVISARAAALTRFTSSYAALAKLPEPTRRTIDVGAWVRRVAALETRVPVRVEEGPSMTIEADGDQLDQLLINLVTNAADASVDDGGEVVLGWQRRGRWLVVEVVDQGCGLPDSANAFVPLFTTKPGGSGIGLVLCRQIAESHGGDVRLADRGDETGCRATVRLPV